MIVRVFQFHRGDVADGLEESAMIELVNPFHGGVFHIV